VTFLQAINAALLEALADRTVLVLGQLVKYGLGGLTTGCAERYPDQIVTMPVAENLMNGAAMGLALAGYRPVVIHERMDFLAVGMDPLVNHIPVWPARAPMSLPVVIFTVVGKGKGQGPQHSKNLTPWFRMLEGWKVMQPASPVEAWESLREAVRGDRPVLYVAHREFFLASSPRLLPQPDRIGLCGASERHEEAFYR
jgi:acetoin:2,6-dichlorophenolindophenol oxidoreductase subunit beta